MMRARSCPGVEEPIFYVVSPNLDGERRGQGRWPGAQLADDAMTPHRLLFIPRARLVTTALDGIMRRYVSRLSSRVPEC